MRASTWIGGMGLASLATIGLFSFHFVAPAPAAPKADTKPAIDERDDLANKLLERVTLKEPFKHEALRKVLETLSDKHGITLIVDPKAFAPSAEMGGEDVFNPPISVPAMKNVRLATILKYIADQVGGLYLIYPDHIKFVSSGRAFTLLKLPMKAYLSGDENDSTEEAQNIIRSVSLLTASFTEKPLQEALKEVELRTNSTIVLAPQAGENGRAFVTARFTNVPVESAVATLAELAGLKMARKGNVLLVTTSERADEFAPGPATPEPPAPAPGGVAPMPAPADQSIEALKMKVAELEKVIAELKQKK